MKKVLIGHRGTGKTMLLSRLKKYFPDDLFIDLDDEIEKTQGRAITQIFADFGEAYFRTLEVAALENLLRSQQKNMWICLGAGFNLDLVPEGIDEFIWVRRSTDDLTRIFFDRPALTGNRYQERENRFKRKATWIYDLPEGLKSESEIEENIFRRGLVASEGVVTTHDETIPEARWIEFRDDQSYIELQEWKDIVPLARQLYSFRKSGDEFLNLSSVLPKKWDWALELGTPPARSPILSLHDRIPGEDLSTAIARLESNSFQGQHLKLAPLIDNFIEVIEGTEWQQSDPKNRSFLPRSANGKWAWVRLWLKGRQDLNFIRHNSTAWLDQPTWWQWLATPAIPEHFAAVLGRPVSHSHSPAFHQRFFSERQMPFWSIEISEHEWEIAIPFLRRLGLVAAAVTSPLKLLAGGNTLTLQNNSWQRSNTDLDGLKALQTDFPGDVIVIWGGGGTLHSIQTAFPQAIAYSQRTGLPRDPALKAIDQCDLLIWAAGPEADPPKEIKTARVLDLNYREDSRAREFALSQKAEYVSGDRLFKLQALAQQKIWKGLKL